MIESVIDQLAGVLVRPVGRAEASLKGVAGFTGAGDVRFSAWHDGHVTLTAELRGVAGVKAELWARGLLVAPLAGDKGIFTVRLNSNAGWVPVALAPGDAVEIRQNSAVILTGMLQ